MATPQQVQTDYFERQAQVESYEIGANGRVRLSALLRMEQETGDEHMDALGLGYERMQQDGIAVLITENSVTVQQMPVRGEKLRLTTRVLGSAGVHLYRDFVYYRGAEPLVHIRQVSVCVDWRSHRPLRPDALYQYGVFHREAVPREERVARVRFREPPPLLGERPVRYSDLDQNRHLNNTVYGDIVEDFLPEEFRNWQRVHISYIAEAKLGDVLLLCGERSAHSFGLTGLVDGAASFSAKAQV